MIFFGTFFLLAQASPATEAESCLMGSVTVPFPVVSALVGLLLLGALLYFTRRLVG